MKTPSYPMAIPSEIMTTTINSDCTTKSLLNDPNQFLPKSFFSKNKTFFIFCSIISYLILGGLIFTKMEKSHHETNCKNTKTYAKKLMIEYLTKHENNMKFLAEAVINLQSNNYQNNPPKSAEYLTKLYLDFGTTIWGKNGFSKNTCWKKEQKIHIPSAYRNV